MAWNARVYKVLIASPSDVPQVRAALPNMLHYWNSIYGEHYGVVFHPVLWETHTRPAMGYEPQTVVNQQIVDTCDAVIATFWTKLGTRTSNSASGTVEEVERCNKAGKPVMIYFYNAPVLPDSINMEEFKRLNAFKKESQAKGLYDIFDSVGELEEKIGRHLTLLAREISSKGQKISTKETESIFRSADVQLPPGIPANQVGEVTYFLGKYRELVAAATADWCTERARKPVSADGAMAILDQLYQHLSMLSVYNIVSVRTDMYKKLNRMLVSLRALIQHQFYIDGGESWQSFWHEGDELMDELQAYEKELRHLLSA